MIIALTLLIQGVNAGDISGTVSGEPYLFGGSEEMGIPGNETLNETITTQLASLPLSFIPNAGQTDPVVQFMVKGSGTSFSFTNTSMLFSMQTSRNETNITPVVITQTFIGANESIRITGEDLLPGTANFFIGDDPDAWRSNTSTYGSLKYHDLYLGIDLLYQGNGSVLKREFIVAPGADPSVIRMAYEDADSLSLDPSGALNITAGPGSMTESRPVCYQEVNGSRIWIGAWYVLSKGNELTIEVEDYDPAYALVIDPDLIYSTYLGGPGEDYGQAIAVDGNGNAYVTGETWGSFPTTVGAYQTTYGGSIDAFISKLNPSGTSLVYSTYLGGSGYDVGCGIAVDGNGNAYVTGWTYGSFPTTVGAYQTTFGGVYDAFISKLNPSGTSLVCSTYLGGPRNDSVQAIAVDGNGNTYVTGETWGSFPTTVGAYQTAFGGGNTDAFISKLNPSGTSLIYSTYLGGPRYDSVQAIAVDGNGNAYVTGETWDSFPTTVDAYQTTFGGGDCDALIAKLNPSGTSLIYSTYLGGSDSECGQAIAVDGAGSAYVTGWTYGSFPTTVDAYQTTFGGGDCDAFISKLNPSGTSLVYSTYLGGSHYDYGNGIAVDGNGEAYMTGYTVSTNFPTTVDAYQTTFGGTIDAFISKQNPSGTSLIYSTYLGGSGYDWGRGIAVDGVGNAYVTGDTRGSFPVTGGSMQTTYGGGGDAFIAKFTIPAGASPTITSITPSTAPNTSSVTITNLSGTAFQIGAKVNLTRSGQANITATSVSILSSGQITCLLPITDAAPGSWTVWVTNTDGQCGYLTDGFTIIHLKTPPIPTPTPTPAPLVANFSGVTVTGTPPLTVLFTDTSSGEPTKWRWNFGDGTRSTLQNPLHVYGGIGRYTVTLEVENKNKSAIIRKTEYVKTIRTKQK